MPVSTTAGAARGGLKQPNEHITEARNHKKSPDRRTSRKSNRAEGAPFPEGGWIHASTKKKPVLQRERKKLLAQGYFI